MAEVAMKVTKLESKSHNNPDEVRAPAKTRVEIVRLPGYTLGRMNMQPGWKWSDSCQVSHVGYAVSGSITVRMTDGTQKTIEAGTSYTIPPGHDAWVEGNQPFQCIEVLSAEEYAKPA
ncbi:cupin domain-containing protein [Mesorhizobium sp. WSM4313]|uniref:cupin domain-containing protein n=1 Tax=Mesorhizobium sp. WSM4313 TaxID=2029412 RepID=UPI000BB0544E|nr:cupin domain-containing protein [Mesorhizobium sp. WSM4313]PBB18356.1 cupin [Mesorhizobium sp. WSM4313]